MWTCHTQTQCGCRLQNSVPLFHTARFLASKWATGFFVEYGRVPDSGIAPGIGSHGDHLLTFSTCTFGAGGATEWKTGHRTVTGALR